MVCGVVRPTRFFVRPKFVSTTCTHRHTLRSPEERGETGGVFRLVGWPPYPHAFTNYFRRRSLVTEAAGLPVSPMAAAIRAPIRLLARRSGLSAT